jgi:hypothetical protein
MSDYAELKIQGKTENEILEQVHDIQKWYANYKGEKTIKVVNTFGETTKHIDLSEIELAIEKGELSAFVKNLPTDSPYITHKELVGKLADGETSQSMRRERRKSNKGDSFSKKLFRKK